MTNPTVTARAWCDISADEFFEIAQLRYAVFALEQRVTEQDFDATDRDRHTVHWWISDGQGCAAYLRTYPLATPELDASCSLGRMAVRQDRRGEGLARVLLDAVMQRHRECTIAIHAQEYVTGLYREFGFTPVGEIYQEAGIAHRMMVRHPDPRM